MALPFADDAFDGATMGFSLRNVVDIDAHAARNSPRASARRALRQPRREQGAESHFGKRLFDLYFYGIVPLIGGLVGGSRARLHVSAELAHAPSDAPTSCASASRAPVLPTPGSCRLMGGSIAIHYGSKHERGSNRRAGK